MTSSGVRRGIPSASQSCLITVAADMAFPTQFPLAKLDDLAAVAGIAGTCVAIVGLIFVIVQLRQAAASARAQATIQFQQAFRNSQPARRQFLQGFPLHRSLERLVPEDERDKWAWWTSFDDDVSPDQKKHAEAVINALNDVAQYVADGLSLRSALQQYHVIFVQAGALLNPVIEAWNAPHEGVPPTRRGVRIVELYNAALAYHRSHWKHAGKQIAITRPSLNGTGEVSVVLVGSVWDDIEPYEGFDPQSAGGFLSRWSVTKAVRGAQRRLRR